MDRVNETGDVRIGQEAERALLFSGYFGCVTAGQAAVRRRVRARGVWMDYVEP